MPAREKTSATFLAAAVEPPGTVERAGEAEIGRLPDGCSARPRYRLLRGELIGRSSRSVAPIILCRQRNYKAGRLSLPHSIVSGTSSMFFSPAALRSAYFLTQASQLRPSAM